MGNDWYLITDATTHQFVPLCFLGQAFNVSVMLSTEFQSAYSQTQTHAPRILESLCALVPTILPLVTSTWKPVQLPSSFICARSIYSPSQHVTTQNPSSHLSLRIPKRKSPTTAVISEPTSHTQSENKKPIQSKERTVVANDPEIEKKTSEKKGEHQHPPEVSGSRISELLRKNKLESATVPELKEFLRNRNQRVSGKKEDLISRVQALFPWNVSCSHHSPRLFTFIFFDNDFSYPVFSSFARVFIAAMYPYGRQPTYGTATSVPSINPYGVPQPYATAPSYPQPQSVAPSFLPPGSNPSSFYQYTKGPAPTAPAQYPNAPVEAIGEKCELVGFLMHRIPNPRAPQHRAPQPSSVHKDRVVHS